MAKSSGTPRTGKAKSKPAADTPAAFEERLATFAEQLGRIAGTARSKADDWTDLDALSKQVATVRGAAVDLLGRIRGSAPALTAPKPAKKKAVKPAAKKKAATGKKAAPAKRTAKAAPRSAKRTKG